MSVSLRTALTAFGLACAAIVVLAQVGRFVPLLDANLGAAVAVVFLYTPVWLARREGKDIHDYGFTTAPVGRGLAFGLLVPALIFPVFLIGFAVFYDVACADENLRVLTPPGLCARFTGWEGVHAPRLGWGFAEAAFIQVVVVALPEELFFRGYIHELCERAMPPRRRVLGGGVGWALVVSSALFAVGHLCVGFDPRRLAVFFPGLLFGWMRSATGSIMAGVIAHALSNLFIDVLHGMFF